VICDLTPTRRHVKATQVASIRQCFISLITRLRHANNVENVVLWKKLLLLTRVLLTPAREEMKWTLAQRCQWVLGDDWSRFTLGSFKSKRAPCAMVEQSESDFLKSKLRRTRSLLKDGEIARAFKALQTKHVVPLSSSEIFEQMEKLHPPAEENDTGVVNHPPADIAQLELTPTEVCRMIRQAKKSATPCGITSLRYELLKQLIGTAHTEEENTCLLLLTWVLTIIVNGKVPAVVMGTMRSTQGAAIPKRDGRIRPLGLRETLVNLALKTALQMCKTTIMGIFENVNYALAGSKKMDELIALMTHSLRACPEHDRIFIDATNAFNLIHRNKAMTAMLAECPQLASVFHALYSGATSVWMRAEEDEWSSLLAEQGCVQGCVMGPLIFGFATVEAYRAVAMTLRDCPNGWFGAYSDDSCISASHDFATVAFRTYLEEGRQSGLNVNFAKGKTEVLLGECESEDEMHRRVQNYIELGVPLQNIFIHPRNGGSADAYGYVHLGIPQGSSEYQLSSLRNLVTEYSQLTEAVRHLDNPQEEWVFTYWVLRQKFPFWLRHMSPALTAQVLQDIEGVLRAVHTPIVGQELTDDAWEQMCLPIKSHGFGVGRIADTVSHCCLRRERARNHCSRYAGTAHCGPVPR